MVHRPSSAFACRLLLSFALSVVCGALAGAPALGQPANAAPPAFLAPDCLAAGQIEDIAALCDRAGEILVAMDGKSDGVFLLRSLGERLHNSSFAGVKLSAPIRFFCLDPRKYAQPWVCQFEVADEAALKGAILGYRLAAEADAPGRNAEEGHLSVRAGRATWCLDQAAADHLLAWQQAHPADPDFRAPGRLRVRLDVARLLQVYSDEFTAQAAAMKERMREALERGSPKPERQQDIASAQASLATALATLRQVADADMGLDMTPDGARCAVSVRPLPGSPLEAFVRSHAPGNLELLGTCPADAALVIAHNVSVMGAVRSLLVRAFGGDAFAWLQSPVAESSGGALFALFLTGRAEAPAEILVARDGKDAGSMMTQWQRFLPEAPGSNDLPFVLKPLPAPEEGIFYAEAAPNEASLGVAGMRALRRLFGASPHAALAVAADRSVLAAGDSPLSRLREALALAGGRDKGLDGSLRANPSFRKSLEGLPEPANMLLYVAPEGIRRWLGLAGIPAGAVQPGEPGLAAAARLSAQGTIEAALNLPTGALREALTRQGAKPSPAPSPVPAGEDKVVEPSAPPPAADPGPLG